MEYNLQTSRTDPRQSLVYSVQWANAGGRRSYGILAYCSHWEEWRLEYWVLSLEAKFHKTANDKLLPGLSYRVFISKWYQEKSVVTAWPLYLSTVQGDFMVLCPVPILRHDTTCKMIYDFHTRNLHNSTQIKHFSSETSSHYHKGAARVRVGGDNMFTVRCIV